MVVGGGGSGNGDGGRKVSYYELRAAWPGRRIVACCCPTGMQMDGYRGGETTEENRRV